MCYMHAKYYEYQVPCGSNFMINIDCFVQSDRYTVTDRNQHILELKTEV